MDLEKKELINKLTNIFKNKDYSERTSFLSKDKSLKDRISYMEYSGSAFIGASKVVNYCKKFDSELYNSLKKLVFAE